MDEIKVTRLCKKLVMSMNAMRKMTPEERRADLIKAVVFMVLLIGIPFIAIPIFMTFKMYGVLMAICGLSWGLFIVLAIRSRSDVFSRFYQVDDGEDNVDVLEGRDLLYQIKNVTPVLMFPVTPYPAMLRLIYNWLIRHKLIFAGEQIKAYQLKGRHIKDEIVLLIDPDIDVLLIPLEGREPDDWKSFSNEGSLLKLQVLSGILKDETVRFTLTNCEYGNDVFEQQLPIDCTIERIIPGPDRPDYCLAKCSRAIKHGDRMILYLIVGTYFSGQQIRKGMGEIALNVAYVLDESVLQDSMLDFSKCEPAAVCMARER